MRYARHKVSAVFAHFQSAIGVGLGSPASKTFSAILEPDGDVQPCRTRGIDLECMHARGCSSLENISY